MIIKYYILYYRNCQEDRNKKIHDREVQRERVINQYKKESEITKQSQYPQVRKYREQNKVNIEASNMKYIRRQIYSLRELKKNAEKYQGKEDIRGYLYE